MRTLKSAADIEKMRQAGIVVWHALQIAGRLVKPGVTTAAIDARIEQFFNDMKVTPLFKGVPGVVPFPAVTCISVNEEVVHGIPGDRVLKEGDIVGIDTGVNMRGWCGDAAVTFPVGKISSENRRLLTVTQRVLQIAIEVLPRCELWSDVARVMQNHARENGFSVIETLVGHGIGRQMHEEPQVPNFVSRAFLRHGDFPIRPGLVIAVEPMINIGVKQTETLSDHWTIVTADRKSSAHFEHTLAVTMSGVRVLTGPPVADHEKIDISAYV